MKNRKKYQWNLKLLYSSEKDMRIEADLKSIEKKVDAFAKKYDTRDKGYLTKTPALKKALTAYEKLLAIGVPKPLLYFFYLTDIDSSNTAAAAKLNLISNRVTVAFNKLIFFDVSIGQIDPARQKSFLKDSSLKHFKFYLSCIFEDAKHRLSVPEEKILSLKSLPGRELWNQAHDRLLNAKTLEWKGKAIPISQAINMIRSMRLQSDRAKLTTAINASLKAVVPFSEAEINAIYTNKKIDDTLRGFAVPYAETVLGYRNDPKVVDNLVKTVTRAFPIAHRFNRIKARLLGQKKLRYYDNRLSINDGAAAYPFNKTVSMVKNTFGKVDMKYADILESFLKAGQIDVFPRTGKAGGGYCSSSYDAPTFILLNHVDNADSMHTLAHEMGHAFHSELSRSQGPLYCGYSTSLAETASTLFEGLAQEAEMEGLSPARQIVALANKINSEITMIFRSIACFNFESDLHAEIRSTGFVPKERIAALHNKNMQAYLGDTFELIPDDGYFFVAWHHIRRFFYVYSYAYGILVSKALLRRYKQDKSFWKKIEQFLSAGGKDSPENILKEIGIDVSKPSFWKEGLKEIEDDISKLEKLTKK
jgi:oligoendopeptidase F